MVLRKFRTATLTPLPVSETPPLTQPLQSSPTSCASYDGPQLDFLPATLATPESHLDEAILAETQVSKEAQVAVEKSILENENERDATDEELEPQPGQMLPVERAPLVIQGRGKARRGTAVVDTVSTSRKKRLVMSITLFVVSLVLFCGALTTIMPANKGHDSLIALNGRGKIDVVSAHNDRSIIAISPDMARRAAEVDGYDPYAHLEQAPAMLASGSTANRFYGGQCTYWANIRYHELTGIWVPWLGDAYQWYGQAIAYHWHSSDYPNPHGPSILVLGPYAQGSYSPVGHVAVVEQDNGDGTVRTSNMHWPTLGVVSYVNFKYPAPGTHFVWATA